MRGQRSHATAWAPLVLALLGCTSTSTALHTAAGNAPLCSGAALGRVAVLLETAWRADQKEPEARTQMAESAVREALGALACGSLEAPGGVRTGTQWSARPEAELLAGLRAEGVDTALLVRVEELTPQLVVTFSLPLLWYGASQADFALRALDVREGTVRLDTRVTRTAGGLFQLRPPAWARDELAAALRELLGPRARESRSSGAG